MTVSSTPAAVREPIYLPTYKLGDEGKPNHFAASTSRELAAIEAKTLTGGDAAFIKRSDLKWTYAVVMELVQPPPGEDGKPATTILRFEVDKDKNRKSFPEAQWGKYIRVIKVEESEMAKLKEEEEEAAKKAEEEAKPDEAPKEDAAEAAVESIAPTAAPTTATSVGPVTEALQAATVPSSAASVGGESAKSNKSSKSKKSIGGSSWFSGIFGTSTSKRSEKSEDSKKTEESSTAKSGDPATIPEEKEEEEAAPATSVAPTAEAPAAAIPSTPDIAMADSVETPIEQHAVEPSTDDPAAAALAATSFPKPGEHEEVSVVPPESAAPSSAAPVTVAPTADPNDTKENTEPSEAKFTAPATFVPAPKGDDGSSGSSSVGSKEKGEGIKLRNPLSLKPSLSLTKKNSIVNKLFNKNKDKKNAKEEKKTVSVAAASSTAPATVPAVAAPPKKEAPKKEWFDPEACEVDYDKNPTDLFQALEARQFPYAEEMFKQVNKQFTKECKTWVVARGQKKKDSHLRFRALPLHAALVFGAPDDMIMKILKAYPKATRGRDVKGRLPIHLAMEHNASESIVASLLEVFPKGFFAQDKKDMTPLDYVNGNMDRTHMKKYVPLLTAAKVEEERNKWEMEKEQALAKQRQDLKKDPVYMGDVVEQVTDEIEMTYATKMEMLESNYQKEIQLLKKKHDSETQALLEGFEVKLNFERKLNKLKGKA